MSFSRPYSDLSPLGEGGSSSSSVEFKRKRDEFDDDFPSYTYDVFISFRGSHTLNTFVDHLYAHLITKGLFVFKDDKTLQRGKSISQQVLHAIQHSRVSIIVFSKDYAESTWCLDEMAAIAQCNQKLKQIVFSVFYDVDPSDVRKQKGAYENSFALRTEQFKHDMSRVHTWKRAMTSLAELGGWDVRNKSEIKEIENIVQAVIKTLDHKSSDMPHSGSQEQSSDQNPFGKGGGASSSSVTSNIIQRYRYDVFISFRGPDTRNTFVDHLYAHLLRKGIFAFKDDKQLQTGESISPQLFQAIKDSRVSIIVFSQHYALSTWCLDEMAAIAECHQELKQIVFPVFYDVDPSDVRKQKGAYENAFDSHAERHLWMSDRIDRWKRTMTSLAGVGGWDVRNKPEFQVIEHIVQAVIKALAHKFSGSIDDLIGIQPRVEELEGLLKLSSKNDKFRVLGILGMSGIGKTTLAMGLYDRISHQFDANCFIENVSKIYKDGGTASLQKQILCQTIDEKNLDTYSRSEISNMVRSRIQNKKLLVVLDDVDQCVQLQELHIDPKLLCAGSRIIITTRDEHILKEYGAGTIHKVPLMNDNDAHELLSRKAFKSDDSSSISADLIHEVLNYAQGLPLAIGVLGSFMCTRNSSEWRATLDRLKNNPPNGVMEVLKIGFEGLEQNERKIFLHIACFFKGERKDYVKRILNACGLHPNIGISLIAEKSLINIRNYEIHMHDMLQELGKQIVKEQYPDEPEFWSRLWLYQDFHRVMMTEKEAGKVTAIVLDQKKNNLRNELKAEGLSNMTRLTLLILCHKNFSGSLISLSNYLRYLSWNGYPFTSLPSQFQPYDLVELNLPDSSIEILWEGIADLPHLKRMDLSNSRNLKKTPSFERMENLERLDFSGCINLSNVHGSIGLLEKLVFLSLRNCCSLTSFGDHFSKLYSLQILLLSGCTELVNSPTLRGASKLEYLDMHQCTSLSKVHESIGTCARLRFLSLRDCSNLVELPDSINFMSSLATLDLSGCSKCKVLPLGRSSSPCKLQSLISLDLSFCNISEMPDGIGELRCLERLNLQGNNFVKLPSTIDQLSSLGYLNLSHCNNLEDLPQLPSGSANNVGRYFETTSESRDHRSGLYIFNCPMVAKKGYNWWPIHFKWIVRLVKEPRHFRGGFDIVSPCEFYVSSWFDAAHRFWGKRIIKTKISSMHVDWVGFVFYVQFHVIIKSVAAFGSAHQSQSSRLPHPFYLSFESEHTEERFDMPLSLELDKIDNSLYFWTIYISREHCHFVKTGAQITFKACKDINIMGWGLCMLTNEDIITEGLQSANPSFLVIDNVSKGSNSSSGPKIQLPYNWLVSDEDEAENAEAKGKETNLFNLGLEIGRS